MQIDDQVVFRGFKPAAESEYADQAFVPVALELEYVRNVGVTIDGFAKTVHYQEVDGGLGVFASERSDSRRREDNITYGTQPYD